MKVILLALFLTSCGFVKTNGDTDGDTVEAPPIVVSPDDPTKVLYNPNVVNTEPEECRHSTIVLITEQTAYEQVLKNVWYTKKKQITQSYEYPEILDADHLHIERATLKSISGDNLSFIDWLRGAVQRENVVWSDNVYDDRNPRESELKYDGSRDIRQLVRPIGDTEVVFEFNGEARGKSPREDTDLQMSLYLSAFYNCE